MRCPFYQEVEAEKLLNKVKVYCMGCQEGRLRIPSFYEEANLCLGKNYPGCRIYITRMQAEEKKDTIISPQHRLSEYLQHILAQLKRLYLIHYHKFFSCRCGSDTISK